MAASMCLRMVALSAVVLRFGEHVFPAALHPDDPEEHPDERRDTESETPPSRENRRVAENLRGSDSKVCDKRRGRNRYILQSGEDMFFHEVSFLSCTG